MGAEHIKSFLNSVRHYIFNYRRNLFWSVSVCLPSDLVTLGRFVAEDPREWSVKLGSIWTPSRFNIKGPILYCFSSISLSCQGSNKTICCPEFQLSKSPSSELYWEQAVSVPAPLNANELHLSTPALPATHPSQGEDATYASSSMC